MVIFIQLCFVDNDDDDDDDYYYYYYSFPYTF